MGSCLAPLGDLLIFSGYDRANGTELWRSDGTADGTVLVKDLNASGGSTPCGFVDLHGALYFTATVDSRPTLWRTDGTSNGTILVHVFQSDSDATLELVSTGTELFLAASDLDHGRELWKSDGTSEGTAIVEDINPGPEGSSPSGLTALGHRVFFRTFASDRNFELWQSDGTPGGTFRIHELSTQPDTLIARAGGLVYFTVLDLNSAELWRTDGTAIGTFAVGTFLAETIFLPPYPYSYSYGPSNLVDLDGVAVFLAKDLEHGWQPWRSDGTVTGTKVIREVPPPSGSIFTIGGFVSSGHLVYFVVDDIEQGGGLWRTDGTAAGTSLLLDIRPGLPSSILNGLSAAIGLAFFQFDDGVHGLEPWRSDGTAQGTFLLTDQPGVLSPASEPFVAVGQTVFFGASRDQTTRLLWKTDGTPAGTALVDDATHGSSSLPSNLTDAGGRVFFNVYDSEFGNKGSLWSSDGTSDGTRSVETFCAIYAPPIRAFRGDAYFFADDCTPGRGLQLWNSHRQVSNIPPDQNVSLDRLAVVGDALFFGINRQLWKTDGTESGTLLVRDFNLGPYFLTVAGGELFFFDTSVEQAVQLWRSDGTAEGTRIVRDLGPGIALGLPPVTLGRRVFFAAYDVSGYELWSSDGTEEGTVRLMSIPPVSSSQMATSGRFLYYFDQAATELWRTDGTEAGAVLLAHVAASNLTDVGGTLFFTGDEGVHGPELWTSTGYPETTRMVRDILPGQLGSSPAFLADAGGVLVFAAGDGVHGTELWRSDGTESGTTMVSEIAPGVISSSPYGFARSGSLVFFGANDGNTGFELWAVPVSGLGVADGPSRASPRVLPPRP